jgi:hypothetical protein
MSLLTNQTTISPSNYFFALSGAGPGPGSNVSSFNTLTTSSFTVSTIVNRTGESLINMDKQTAGLKGVTISTSGQFIVESSTGITLYSPQNVQVIAGRISDLVGVINLQASTINVQRNVSSTVTVPTNIVSLGCGVLTNFSSMTISSINTHSLSGTTITNGVSSITFDQLISSVRG